MSEFTHQILRTSFWSPNFYGLLLTVDLNILPKVSHHHLGSRLQANYSRLLCKKQLKYCYFISDENTHRLLCKYSLKFYTLLSSSNNQFVTLVYRSGAFSTTRVYPASSSWNGYNLSSKIWNGKNRCLCPRKCLRKVVEQEYWHYSRC